MADRFIERVAAQSGRTVRRLRELQWLLASSGLPADAAALEPVIREHEDIVFDCGEDTAVGSRHVHPRTPEGASKPTDR